MRTIKRNWHNSDYMLTAVIAVILAGVTWMVLCGGIEYCVKSLVKAIDGEIAFTEHQLDKSLSREQREEIIGRLAK